MQKTSETELQSLHCKM
uniref:Uncharacterized protein n=1 Tax=Anguilla anguilla TaxID=7936 RepID=A0A0E9VQV8_ANGAN